MINKQISKWLIKPCVLEYLNGNLLIVRVLLNKLLHENSCQCKWKFFLVPKIIQNINILFNNFILDCLLIINQLSHCFFQFDKFIFNGIFGLSLSKLLLNFSCQYLLEWLYRMHSLIFE